MHLLQKTLFHSDLLSIRHAVARPPQSELLQGLADLMLLPLSGVFAKHDSSREHVIANANHALFFSRDKLYRISFPGNIGDESLVLQFSDQALASLLAESVGVEQWQSPKLHRHCLLSPSAVLERHRLFHALHDGSATQLAVEESCVAMLSSALRAACKDERMAARATPALTQARRRRQVEAVKEAISLAPSQDWSLAALARQANASPYHLARVFRETVGMPVFQYLIRTRLCNALEAMRTTDASLTDIALASGFSSSSHFSSSFRSLFGTSPSRCRN